MSKPGKRPGRRAPDTFESIKAQADAAKAAPRFAFRDASASPALEALMHSARRSVAAAMPSTFEHEGRVFYLRVCLAMQLDIFDAPGAAEPLMRGMVLSSDDFGHAPGH